MPNLGELRYDEVRRIPLLRTRVNSASPRSRPRPGREGDVILPEGIYRVVKLIGDGSGEPLRWRPGDMPYILASPLGASLVNEQKVAGLVSPTDVVGNIKSGKRASQKRGDLRSHERCHSNLELIEGEGALYRARPHWG